MALRRTERCPLPGDHEPHAHPSWDGPYCPGVDAPEPKPYVEPESCLDVVIPGLQTFPGCGHRTDAHRGFGGCTVDGCECPRGRAPVTPPRRRTRWPVEYEPAPAAVSEVAAVAPGNTPSPTCTDSFHAALVDRFDAMVEAGRAERDEAAADDTLDVFSAAAEAEAERLAVECAVEGRGDVSEPVARDLATIAVRTALGAPGVRRAITSRDALGNALTKALADGEAENARLAAALADAERRIEAALAYCASLYPPAGECAMAPSQYDLVGAVRAALAGPAGATEGTGE